VWQHPEFRVLDTAALAEPVAPNANCSLRQIVSESLVTECVTLRSCLGFLCEERQIGSA
jgi:hypothetical protein